MNKKGFTLVETILTIIVVGIIAGVSGQVLMRGIDAYSMITNRKDAIQHARVGMDRMMYELLLVDSSKLTSVSDTRIDFVDMNGSAANFRRANVYGTLDLVRGNDFLAGQVALLDFDFFKSDGTSAVFPWDVRRISIELTAQALGGYGTIPLRTEVFPRNFMYTNFR
jgi:prepilin-type N-terminal cleavage/methylation domain-containing protein